LGQQVPDWQESSALLVEVGAQAPRRLSFGAQAPSAQ